MDNRNYSTGPQLSVASVSLWPDALTKWEGTAPKAAALRAGAL